jgi:hypothetical protein
MLGGCEAQAASCSRHEPLVSRCIGAPHRLQQVSSLKSLMPINFFFR